MNSEYMSAASDCDQVGHSKPLLIPNSAWISKKAREIQLSSIIPRTVDDSDRKSMSMTSVNTG
jgi:hypothetical protein